MSRALPGHPAPALNAATAKAMPAGDPAVRVVRVGSAGATVGFVAEFASSGFVVMRADDRLPAQKLYAAQGTFASLPPAMQRVLTWELEQEARALASQQVEVVALREGKEQKLTFTTRVRGKAWADEVEFKEWGMVARNLTLIAAIERQRPHPGQGWQPQCRRN